MAVYDGRAYCPDCESYTLPDRLPVDCICADRLEYEAFAVTPEGMLEYVRWRIAVLREAEADLVRGANG